MATLDASGTTPGSGANTIAPDTTILFSIRNTIPAATFDLSSINVTLNVYSSDGIIGEAAFTSGVLIKGYNGYLSVLTDGPDFVLRGSLKRNAKFPYNLPVTITIDGLEGVVPFSLNYTFTTLIVSGIQPAASTPSVALPPADTSRPPRDGQVDRGISFKLNANPEWNDTEDPNYIDKHLSVIDISSISLDVSLDGVVDSVIVTGTPQIASDFIATITPDSTGGSINGESGYNIIVLRKYAFLPYDTFIEVRVQGTETVYTPSPSIHSFDQSFNFKTQASPIVLDSIGEDSLNSIQSTYSGINTDGVLVATSFTGTGIIVQSTTDPSTARLVDATNSPFLSASFSDKKIDIVGGLGSDPKTTRTTKIKTIIDAQTVELDITNRPDFASASESVDSYTVYLPVIQSTAQVRASPPGGIDADSQVRSATNGIFLSMQRWAQSLAAFRSTFYSNQLLAPTGTDWPIYNSAYAIADSNNSGLTVNVFPYSEIRGVGFYLDVPVGANGIFFSLKGRTQTSTVSDTYVGAALYYRQVPANAAVGAWSLPVPLEDLSIPTGNMYFQYFQQEFEFNSSLLSLLPGTLYQFEFIRVPPTGAGHTDLPYDFYLLNLTVDFG